MVRCHAFCSVIFVRRGNVHTNSIFRRTAILSAKTILHQPYGQSIHHGWYARIWPKPLLPLQCTTARRMHLEQAFCILCVQNAWPLCHFSGCLKNGTPCDWKFIDFVNEIIPYKVSAWFMHVMHLGVYGSTYQHVYVSVSAHENTLTIQTLSPLDESPANTLVELSRAKSPEHQRHAKPPTSSTRKRKLSCNQGNRVRRRTCQGRCSHIQTKVERWLRPSRQGPKQRIEDTIEWPTSEPSAGSGSMSMNRTNAMRGQWQKHFWEGYQLDTSLLPLPESQSGAVELEGHGLSVTRRTHDTWWQES